MSTNLDQLINKQKWTQINQVECYQTADGSLFTCKQDAEKHVQKFQTSILTDKLLDCLMLKHNAQIDTSSLVNHIENELRVLINEGKLVVMPDIMEIEHE